jgi:protein gp37
MMQQATSIAICIVWRYSRKVALYRLSLSDSFKSNVAIVPVRTVDIIMHAVSVRNIYRVLPATCCQLL